MTSENETSRPSETSQTSETTAPYRSLPDKIRLDETVAGVPTRPTLDPDAARNVDQHSALRDD